jgi:oligoendopeptidase F
MSARHPYAPTFSFGNIVSTIGIIAGGVAVWVALQISVARADEKITSLQAQVATEKESTSKRLDSMDAKISSLDAKASTMAEKQAALLANIELIMRAQGLRPVERDR